MIHEYLHFGSLYTALVLIVVNGTLLTIHRGLNQQHAKMVLKFNISCINTKYIYINIFGWGCGMKIYGYI